MNWILTVIFFFTTNSGSLQFLEFARFTWKLTWLFIIIKCILYFSVRFSTGQKLLTHPGVSVVIYICNGAVLRTDNQCLMSPIYKGPFETHEERDNARTHVVPFMQSCWLYFLNKERNSSLNLFTVRWSDSRPTDHNLVWLLPCDPFGFVFSSNSLLKDTIGSGYLKDSHSLQLSHKCLIILVTHYAIYYFILCYWCVCVCVCLTKGTCVCTQVWLYLKKKEKWNAKHLIILVFFRFNNINVFQWGMDMG